MFSGFELKVIESWALTGKEILQGHLNSPCFTHSEKEDKRREYSALESIISEVQRVQQEYVSADADQLGHCLWVIEEHSKWLQEQWDTAEITTEDYTAERYQIGYMQARVELGFLTWSDIHVIEEWEGEMP